MSINVDVRANTAPLERDVQAAIQRINRAGGMKIRLDDKGITQPLGNMKRSADEFSKSLEASNARVLAFGASVGIINAVSEAFKGLVASTMQVEKNLTDINVVMGLSSKQLDKFGAGLFKVAKETGAGFAAASEAATEFARQGLSLEETLKRTNDALILTRLTGMKAADSVKSLTAAMNTFKGEITDSTTLVSKFAAVDVKFAVSAEDFAQAIARSGQAARDAGVNIDQLIGLVTAAQERTARGGAVIGNSFKTIFTRVQRSSTLNELENLGIAVRDLQGNTLPAIKILESLAQKYETLNDAQRSYISQNVAGVFQVNILKAALSDLAKTNNVTTEATNIASNATDESVRKNEQLRQTMSALAGETGVAVQELAKTIGDLALAPGINKVLDGVKGLAEGVTGLLGNGEEQGSTFAKGLLKGIGNILTGPGLIVFGAIFTKLFVNAAKYAATSLASLLSINKASSTRKNIEQSLMMVLTQQSAVQEELLRNDISRAQKEKIILDLIRQQTNEAQKLQALSRSMAPGLMRAGVGPGLTRRSRAFGFVPNFAEQDDEKRMARAGGYAPGHIKTMNIPGEGGLIYNSSESVRKFPGLSQPAIMPPKSSKAGVQYQADFAQAHGFDPYAANGYVPNFSLAFLSRMGTTNATRGRSLGELLLNTSPSKLTSSFGKADVVTGKSGMTWDKLKSSPEILKAYNLQNTPQAKHNYFKKPIIDATRKYTMYVPGQSGDMTVSQKGISGGSSIYGQKGLPSVKFNILGIDPNVISRNSTFRGGSKALQQMLGNKGYDYVGREFANNIKLPNTKFPKVQRDAVEKIVNSSGKDGGKGALAALAGAVFEAAIGKRFNIKGSTVGNRVGNVAIGGDFDTGGGKTNLGTMKKLFGMQATALGDFKISASADNKTSFAKKILQREMFEVGGQKSFTTTTKGGKTSVKYIGPKLTSATTLSEDFYKKRAGGYIPNYADPLSSAIGREQAAGVPVSKIRVGTHKALVRRSNPYGLGVTNTSDEPNGLKDVFGARGYVPNYAFQSSDFGSGTLGIRSGGVFLSLNDAAKKANKELKKLTKAFQEGKINKDQFNRGIKNISTKYNLNAQTTERVTREQNKSIGAIGRLNAMRNRAARSPMGRMAGRMGMGGGVVAMMGAGMVAGQIQASDPEGTSTLAQGSAGGLNMGMTGASMGAMIGSMIAPGIGTAIGGAIGGVGGAIYGFMSGVDSAKKAKDEETKAVEQATEAAKKNAEAFTKNSMSQTLGQAAATNTFLQKFGTAGGGASNIMGLDDERQVAARGLYAASEIENEKMFRGMSLSDAITGLTKTRAGQKTEFSEKMSGQYNVRGRLQELNTKLRNRANSSNPYATDLKNLFEQFSDVVTSDGENSDLAKFSRISAIEYNKFKAGDREGIDIDSLESRKLGQIATNSLNNMISNIYSSGSEAGKIHSMSIKNPILDEKGQITKDKSGAEMFRTREVDLTGNQIARLQRGDKDLMKELGMTENNLSDFQDVNRKALQRQNQIYEEQSKNLIKTLNFQRVELELRSQLNKNLQGIEHASRASKNKDTAITSIMGSNMTAAGRQQMENSAAIRDANSNFAKAQATAQNKFKTDIFKSISSDTVAGQQFRSVFGATRNADTGEVNFTDNKGNKIEKREDYLKTEGGMTIAGLFGANAKGEFGDSGDEEKFKRFFENATASGIESALASLDLSVFNKIVDPDAGLAQGGDQQALQTKFSNSKKELEETVKLKKDDLDFTLRELDGLDQKKSVLAQIKDEQTKNANEVRKQTLSMQTQNSLESKRIELIKVRRALEQGSGPLTLQQGLDNNLQDLRLGTGQSIQAVRDKETIDKLTSDSKVSGLDAQRALLGQQIYESNGDPALVAEYNELTRIMNLEIELRKIRAGGNAEEIAAIEEIAEKRAQMLQQELERKTGDGAFSNGFEDALVTMSNQSSQFAYNMGNAIPNAFANSMSRAMGDVINQGKDLGDALRDAAIGFLSTLNRMYTENFARNVMTSMGGVASSPSGGVKKHAGGIIHMNKGGMVPAQLSNGEYVMGSDAVRRYGVSMMDAVNTGHIQRKSFGGMIATGFGQMAAQKLFGPKEQKPHEARKKDRFETDPAFLKHNMSANYMQTNSRAQEYINEQRSKQAEERQKWIQKQAKKAELGRQVVNIVGNAAMTKLGNHLEESGAFAKADLAMGFGGTTQVGGETVRVSPDGRVMQGFASAPGNTYNTYNQNPEAYAANKQIQNQINDGQKYFLSRDIRQSMGMQAKDFEDLYLNQDNFGDGPISGRMKSMGEKIDSIIPGGAQAKSKENKEKFIEFFNKFKNRDKRKNMNAGGPVVGASGIDQIPAMLSEGEYVIRADAARKIGRPTLESMNAGKFNNGGIITSNSSGMQDRSGASANTNNISITVNVNDKGGSSEKKESEPGSEKKDKMDKMSARIKDQVVTVIKEESRPGGLLDKGEGN